MEKRRLVLVSASLIGVLLLIGLCGHDDRNDATSPGAALASLPAPTSINPLPHTQPGDTTSALTKLAALPIKGRAPKTGYERSLFGPAWTDDVTVAGGHNGCDTRNDILRRDLDEVEIKAGSKGCTVLAGVLHDPYSGATAEFRRGHDTSSEIHVDHIVALADAWQKGAQQWDPIQRRNFANDPINLQATTASINEQKSDGDAATWLPPNKSYRCTYVSRIIEVKAAYALWVTQAERDAIAGILITCGRTAAAPEPPPAPATLPSSPTSAEPAPAPVPAPVPVPTSGSSVYYPDCKAVRNAGAAPLYAGQPGYRPGLDRDGDGVACE
ncbi:deoxyribonuclease [Mycobacterium gordonae]|uniref:Deoxyribonuclease n=1 Tax=Mycobacterium gordonae TaxID=1778 RepID=A0A0Q2MG59_MYCGO|nr:deoxyribonuclease [Mycobacterium gordonae]